MGRSQHVRRPRRVVRRRRQRILDALGYVGAVMLAALIAHKHMSHAPRGPEPQSPNVAATTPAARTPRRARHEPEYATHTSAQHHGR